ncbi:MAG: DoxX family membrane protein [Gemmatimonadota bacterium]
MNPSGRHSCPGSGPRIDGPLSAEDRAGWCWAAFFSRAILGTLFLVPGWHKVVEMGALTHARRLFVEGFAEHWIPTWLLWLLGTVIPFIELMGGLLLVLGLWTRKAAVALGFVLVLVTYGHLLQEPFFVVTGHILPRLLLVLLILVMPRGVDRWSTDRFVRERRENG